MSRPRARLPLFGYLLYDKKLPDKPEVFRIMAATGLSQGDVVLALLRFWGWVDDHYPDGRVCPASFPLMSQAVPGTGDPFWASLLEVGWLERCDGGFEITNFAKWTAATAKVRERERLRKWNLRHDPTLCPRDTAGHEGGHEGGHGADTNGSVVPQGKGKGLKKKNPPSSPPGGDGFEAFWASFPRKVAKQDAVRAWNRLAPDAALRATIQAALERQRASEAWRREDGRFIPYPATWLNGRRWEDELGAGARPETFSERMARLRQEANGCDGRSTTPGPSSTPPASGSGTTTT